MAHRKLQGELYGKGMRTKKPVALTDNSSDQELSSSLRDQKWVFASFKPPKEVLFYLEYHSVGWPCSMKSDREKASLVVGQAYKMPYEKIGVLDAVFCGRGKKRQ